MGKKNDAVRSFLAPKERYADFFNGSVYGGEQRITADMLEEVDGTYGDGTRDLIRRVVDGTRLAIFAVENQDSVDYTMPLRMLEYDCKEYKKQVREIEEKHAEEVRGRGKKPCYWNTRLREVDRLMPVHSVCFYHGSAQWTGPRSLKDMAEVLAVLTDNKKFLEHKDDYKNGGGYNMCKAMDNLMELKKNEGRAEGRATALTKGIRRIMSELKYTADQAMELLGVPEEEWDNLRAKL